MFSILDVKSLTDIRGTHMRMKTLRLSSLGWKSGANQADRSSRFISAYPINIFTDKQIKAMEY